MELQQVKISPYLLAGPAALLTGIGAFLLSETVRNTIADIRTDRRINSLHPSIRKFARAFIDEARRRGHNLQITSGLRTWFEQSKLYSKGRTIPGKKVTDARAGGSYHNYGLAIDVVEYIDGKPDWKRSNWTAIAVIGKRHGFSWGGDWKGKLVDKPHFQKGFGLSIAKLKVAYLADKKVGDYVDLRMAA